MKTDSFSPIHPRATSPKCHHGKRAALANDSFPELQLQPDVFAKEGGTCVW
jgi:hypothetical protein